MPRASAKTVKIVKPYVEIVPDANMRWKISEEKEQAYGNRQLSQQRFGPLCIQVLQSGTNEEILAILIALKDQDTFYYLGYNHQAWRGALQERATQHAAELNGQWSNLLDALFYTYASLKISKVPVIKKWGKWAESLTLANMDQEMQSVISTRASIPLEAVAKRAKVFTPAVIKKILREGDYSKALMVFLDREDLSIEFKQEAIKQELAKWGIKSSQEFHGRGGSHYSYAPVLREILRRPAWHINTLMDDLFLVARQRQALNLVPKEKACLRRELADTIAHWQGNEPEYWQRAIDLFQDDPKILAKLMSNPGFPIEVARAYLKKGGISEVRIAISRNPIWIKDPEFRKDLEASGQNIQVWRHLLTTSEDPVEAGRLFSFVASKDPVGASYLLIRQVLPEGIVIPKEVLAKVMASQEYRSQRVKMIQILPSVKPIKETAPDLPLRAKKGIKP